MRRLALIFALLCLLAPGRADASPPKTLFDYVLSSWAVAKAVPSRELKYRQGQLLGYPTDLVDVIYARRGKPRSIFLVYEKQGDGDETPFEVGKPFLAPFGLLPQYKYWRDNLPNVPHQQVLGGKRYVFEGDDIERVAAVVRKFTATFTLTGKKRLAAAAEVVAEALDSPVEVVAEDAARYLATKPANLALLGEEGRKRVASYLTSDRDGELVASLAEAVGRAHVESLKPALEEVAAGHTLKAASALVALELMGHPRSTEHLIERLDDPSEAVRSYAARILGTRAAADEKARDAALRVVVGDDSVSVRSAAATGLGLSGYKGAINALGRALERGDDVAHPAALALAKFREPKAWRLLEDAVLEGRGEAPAAAVVALGQAADACGECARFLREQRKEHPQKAIRDLIEIVLAVDRRD